MAGNERSDTQPLATVRAAVRSHPFSATCVAVVLVLQAALGFFNAGEAFTRGHNGWNTSAYHQSAKNTLRWGVLFPLQYDTGVTPPEPHELYTHHPLGMHLHNTAAFAIFGDHYWTVRTVMAVHGVLAAAALSIILWWLYAPWLAAIGTLTFVASPVNAIYINMANHSSGFIAWGFVALGLHILRMRQLASEDRASARRSHWAFCAAFVMAALWDWPAAYLAAGVCIHLLLTTLRWRREQDDRAREAWWQLWSYVLIGGGTVVAHVLLAESFAGGVAELASTAGSRTDVPLSSWTYHLKVVPALMVTWPLLVGGALWFIDFGVRAVQRTTTDRDLIPLVFGLGGAVHYVLFRWSAIVHSYWAWTMMPFFAVAIVDLASRLSRRRVLQVAAPALVATYLCFHTAQLFLPAREVGGAMWFVRRVRNHEIKPYHSSIRELRFAERVREWLDRDTGVLVHKSIQRLGPEPRFYITLDRAYIDIAKLPQPLPRQPLQKWALIAQTSAYSPRERALFAGHYRYREQDGLFMVDFGSPADEPQVFRGEASAASLWHRYFVSAFHPPQTWIRDRAAEARLSQSVPPR